jgi:hypothetical protein
MADDINALLAGNRSSSVLEGIANPPQINVLGSISAGTQAASQMYDLRQKQAQEAAGQAFLNSIDPATGQPNQALLMQNLRNNPRAAMAAQTAAAAGQTLDANTYKLHNERTTSMMSGMGQLIADNPNGVPLEAAHALIDHRLQLGLITPQEAQAMKATMSANPIKNTQVILQGMGSNLSAQLALQAARPGIGTVETGQGTQGTQTPAALSSTGTPGSISPVGAPIATGLPSFKDMLGQVDQPADAATAKALGIPEGTTVTLPIIQRWIQQGGGGLVRGQLPGAPAPATPALPVNPNAPGGRIVPTQPALQPKPAAGAPAATPAATTTAATPAFTPVVTGQPPGRAEDVTQWQAANAAIPDAKRNEAAGVAALQALEYAHTGPGTGNVAAVRNFMITQGIPGYQFLDSTQDEQRQIAKKNLLRFAQSSGAKAGTDLGLTTQLESNANVDTMLQTVNTHILKGDLGLARQRIAQQLTAPDKGTGKTEFGDGQGEHVKNFTSQTDPVAFAWDKLDENERAAHLAAIAKVQGGMEKWKRSMKIARDTGLIQVPTAPDRRSEVMPQMMPAPLPNALLA